MFSGIVESMAKVVRVEHDRTNIHFTFTCPFADELHLDQSVAHNGVCLTVVHLDQAKKEYTVTVMEESLRRSNLGLLKEGDMVNVERSMRTDGRLDGHIVQGHVDQTARCIEARETDGSWYYRFEYEASKEMLERGYFCVDKGSVCINGVSLTVCEPDIKGDKGYVSVCIIPYTHEMTNFKFIKEGTIVNLEFDILGKYIANYAKYLKQI
ncbi:MAG: riboflavin synthase [Paludibacteraceae bacterium]|jgi:riboflavin synthase|nr:riboflavin synthase [Paludibacteraceae bacterium]